MRLPCSHVKYCSTWLVSACCRLICCRLYDGLLILICFAVIQYSVSSIFFFFGECTGQDCRGPWLRWRRCHSLSAIMGQAKQTRPTYSNSKHLLAFFSCHLVLYSTSRVKWRWPELSCSNIWNNVSFHSSVLAALAIFWDSPACIVKPNPDPLLKAMEFH